MADRPKPEPSEERIQQQAEEITRLRAEVERLERDHARLRRENERLRKELDLARRAGYRQAAPFSRGTPTRHPQRPGRKPGALYGRQGRRPLPPVINQIYDVPLLATCPDCGGVVDDTHTTAQYQVDVPPVQPVVRRFEVHIGKCRQWGRRVQGRHPLQTSDALGAAVTPTTTVYAILPGRGFDEAACLLGPAFAGVLVRDGWAPYQQFTEAAHQTCLTHLGRRARELRTDHPRTVLPGQVEDVLHDALDVRDRYAAGTMAAQGVAIARGRLINRLSSLLGRSTTVAAVQRFVAHLNREWTALFSFLFDLEIDATSYRAEHAIRWAVVTRKMCGGGNRTTRGAVTQFVLASVLRTARQRGVDRHAIFVAMLRAPTPIPLPVFQTRAAPPGPR